MRSFHWLVPGHITAAAKLFQHHKVLEMAGLQDRDWNSALCPQSKWTSETMKHYHIYATLVFLFAVFFCVTCVTNF